MDATFLIRRQRRSRRTGTGALERMWDWQGLGFSLGEEGRIVLSEVVLDSAASEEATTDDLEEETESGEGRGY